MERKYIKRDGPARRAKHSDDHGSPDKVQEGRILRCEDMQRKHGEAMNVYARTKSCEAKIRELQTETSELRGALVECIDSLTQRAADRVPPVMLLLLLHLFVILFLHRILHLFLGLHLLLLLHLPPSLRASMPFLPPSPSLSS
jgi:hypothetical protein